MMRFTVLIIGLIFQHFQTTAPLIENATSNSQLNVYIGNVGSDWWSRCVFLVAFSFTQTYALYIADDDDDTVVTQMNTSS